MNTWKNNLLDLAYTNSEIVSQSGTLNNNLSDHLPIYFTLKKPTTKAPIINFLGRSYKNYDKDYVIDMLKAEDWTEFYNCDDPNRCWEIKDNRIRKHIDSICPLRNRKIRDQNKVWMSRELMEKIIDKNNALITARTTGLEADWEASNKIRNKTKKLVHLARAEYIQDYGEHDPKTFWEKINLLLPSKSPNST